MPPKTNDNIHNIPTSFLYKYKEFDRLCGDNIHGDNYILYLGEDILKNGIKSPVTLQIDSELNALLVEGNHRVCLAVMLGITNIPTKIKYAEFGSVNKSKAKKLNIYELKLTKKTNHENTPHNHQHNRV